VKLEKIGFYTLTDERARTASVTSLLSRCELILTDRCNFSCPYCDPLREDCRGDMDIDSAKSIVHEWARHGLKAIRFSGGEPTLWKDLSELVSYTAKKGIDHIAISTNGAASWGVYKDLLYAGVNDFSISLDACCSATGKTMCGGRASWEKVTKNIEQLSYHAFITVGIVLTEDNVAEAATTVILAHKLGVTDIRIIPAATSGDKIDAVALNVEELRSKCGKLFSLHPILEYRMNRMKTRPIRGLLPSDNNRCPLVMDDAAVAGKEALHFPCIIYMRRGGKPMGSMHNPQWREDRGYWAAAHNTHEDPICKGYCLDVCVDYNNRVRELKGNKNG